MTVAETSSLTRESLEEQLQQDDASVLLVSSRILRRVIKRDCELGGIGLRVPHSQCYHISRDALFHITTPVELQLPPKQELTESVLLLERPYSHELEKTPELTLLRYWRLLFHIRIHLELHRLHSASTTPGDDIRKRIQRIGFIEFEEIKAVLKQEYRLFSDDPRVVYEEFVALFFELKYFAHHRLGLYFPSLAVAEVEAMLHEDLDSKALFEATRLVGAADPEQQLSEEADDEDRDEGADFELTVVPDARRYQKLIQEAATAEAKGNFVAAALRKMKASYSAVEQNEEVRTQANNTIEKLADRLREPLALAEEQLSCWKDVLVALLEPAVRRFWSREARLLYDLQKVCVDHERPLYSVDIVEWLVSWGKRPIKTELPNQGLVLKVQHLRSALNRSPASRIAEGAHGQLNELLHDALHHCETELRDKLRPVLAETLDEVGLSHENYVEEVERNKLVEELLDMVVERGYLNMSLVRDAIARNRVKLPDLTGVGEFFSGDPLIKSNRLLALRLPGIYHRGEIYLRWLQRISSIFFANKLGRVVTKYLLLPFVGAFFILKFSEHLLGSVLSWIGKAPAEGAAGVSVCNRYSVFLLGIFFLGVLYIPTFRAGVKWFFQQVGRCLRLIYYDIPVAAINSWIVQRIFRSRWYLLAYQYLLKPLFFAAGVGVALYLGNAQPEVIVLFTLISFLGALYLTLTRFVQQFEEAASEGMVLGWHLLRDDIFPGLYRAIVEFFRWILDRVDRIIYTVDEWLRFQGGQSRFTLVAKTILGFFWWLITYILRFCVTLLIEPQINPIKHFPVVTVSHKILLPFIPHFAFVLTRVFNLAEPEAFTISTLVIFGIPGIFGFFAWELKENWKLYDANQSATLDPERVGSHGETFLGFLRPGFHSGTIPKLYAKLRRRPNRTGPRVRKYHELLHHVQIDIRHFVERDLIALLEGSNAWSKAPLAVSKIVLGTKRIRIALACPNFGDDSVVLDFEQHGRWIIAGISNEGWLPRLKPQQRYVWLDALAGFYKLAGVSLVREHLDSLLPEKGEVHFLDDGIAFHLQESEQFLTYRLTEPASDADNPEATPIPRERILLSDAPILWSDWVENWRRDRKGVHHRSSLLQQFQLLPQSEDRVRNTPTSLY